LNTELTTTKKDLILAVKQDIKKSELALANALQVYADYTDPTGHKSKGPGGFKIQMNVLIKKHFGSERDSLNERQLRLLATLLQDLSVQIVDCISNSQLSRTIKDKAYATINDYGRLAGTLQ
jgi:hypothetical protein